MPAVSFGAAAFVASLILATNMFPSDMIEQGRHPSGPNARLTKDEEALVLAKLPELMPLVAQKAGDSLELDFNLIAGTLDPKDSTIVFCGNVRARVEGKKRSEWQPFSVLVEKEKEPVIQLGRRSAATCRLGVRWSNGKNQRELGRIIDDFDKSLRKRAG